jgi:TetR/AcrR family fatty acid metabolism transcriptional regulator
MTPSIATTNKRELIVRAARQRFRKYGVRKTSMHEIAADAGMAVGTIYLYFKDKKELIVGCSDAFAEKHQKFARKIVTDQRQSDEKLRDYVVNRFKAIEETRSGSSHAADIARTVMHLQPQRAQEDERWIYETVLALLKEGIADGVFDIADPERDADVFVQSIRYFLPWAHKQPYREPTLDNLTKITDWFLEKWMA